MNSRAKRLAPLIAGVLAVALFVPALASATIYHGTFNGHQKMRITEGKSGIPKKIVFQKRRAQCKEHNVYFAQSDFFARPFDRASKSYVHDQGTYRLHGNGYHLAVHASITGRKVSPKRWSGTYKVKIDVKRHGRQWDTCVFPKTHWTAVK